MCLVVVNNHLRSIIVGALLVASNAGCNRNGSVQSGETGLSLDSGVRFVRRQDDSALLSPQVVRQLVTTLRSDARYFDHSGWLSAPYGKFQIGTREYFLHHGFICDSQDLKGRFWFAPWIDRVIESLRPNAPPRNAHEWALLFESAVTSHKAQPDASPIGGLRTNTGSSGSVEWHHR